MKSVLKLLFLMMLIGITVLTPMVLTPLFCEYMGWIEPVNIELLEKEGEASFTQKYVMDRAYDRHGLCNKCGINKAQIEYNERNFCTLYCATTKEITND